MPDKTPTPGELAKNRAVEEILKIVGRLHTADSLLRSWRTRLNQIPENIRTDTEADLADDLADYVFLYPDPS